MNINNKKHLEILEVYNKFKTDILKAINLYKETINYDEEDYFSEIAFCILTPQSKAKNAWNAIITLKENRLLFNGNENEISNYLNVVRFKNNKAKYLVELRKLMSPNGFLESKKIINSIKTVDEKREYILNNIKGMGLKEAAHVLRNLGFGRYLAILDRHVLKNLKELGVIDVIPKTLTKKIYFDIERKMIEYSKYSNIGMDELDLVFWASEAGEVFK